MELLKNERYISMLWKLVKDFPDWGKMEGKGILISGASGMLGSLLIDTLMLRNESVSLSRRNRIFATSRNAATAEKRFARWMGKEEFHFFAQDITKSLDGFAKEPELLIHAASTTHPAQYTGEPINTILSNIFGTRNMLEVAARVPGSRVLLMSSVEIYGENRGDAEYFEEGYCGYLDCNTLRAGYPEAKRVSETLCQAYIKEKNMDAVIIRLPRCYGPTMRMSDTKAISQFIKNGLAGENIVLKSEGNQFYSYAFATDAVLGMLYVLANGKCGEAYDLADQSSNISLKDLANFIARTVGCKVIFELPDAAEKTGYSTATRAVMRGEKLKQLGWNAQYDIKSGIKLTMGMLKDGV